MAKTLPAEGMLELATTCRMSRVHLVKMDSLEWPKAEIIIAAKKKKMCLAGTFQSHYHSVAN